MKNLPLDILLIYSYLPFEKIVQLDSTVAKKMYNPEIHTWQWVRSLASY